MRIALLSLLLVQSAWAALPAATDMSLPASATTPRVGLAEKLTNLRSRVLDVEQELIDGMKVQKQAKGNLRKIQELLKLQRQESELGHRRQEELEHTIQALESRRTLLHERIGTHRHDLRQALQELDQALREGSGASLTLPETERLAAPRRHVLANRVSRELREIEALKADLADADQLQSRIDDEKEQLAYLFQDLKEKESVLELNRQLQSDILARGHQERVDRLASYRKLKSAESNVEKLIGEFNARVELENNIETERVATRAMSQGAFARRKGQLSLPVVGPIVSEFGRHFDAESKINVFRKGVDIGVQGRKSVQAVAAGRVAYAGELPNYGRVTIIDHGDHYYTLCANLGELSRQVGDAVNAGDSIGYSDGTAPVYFEIRSRNVAVNPLQWVSSSANLSGYGATSRE